ncbi:MAG: hypothetical protein HFF50_04420 [Lawsonibacter sp.]|nr:hypothetical protein [Lawsonibacter sp.]
MSEQSERLLRCISDIGEEKIDEGAQPLLRRKRTAWRRWGALAAAVVLVVGAVRVLPRMGGMASGGGAAAPSGGTATAGGGAGEGPGEDEGTAFQSYAGPVLPLTLGQADSEITAQREITLDFAPWIKRWRSNEDEANSREDVSPETRQEILEQYNEWFPEGGRWQSSTDIQVTDAYTLTNTSKEEKTVSVLYPFVSSLSRMDSRLPVLSADGQPLETGLRTGQYAGGWRGTWAGDLLLDADFGSIDRLYLDSWADYRNLLADGAYLETALEDSPDFSGIPVVVYEFSHIWGPEKGDFPNPTLRSSFSLDYTKTNVLTYGFNGGSFDQERGWMGREFSIPQPGEPDDGEGRYLIVLGEDIGAITAQGYETGGWDNDRKIEAGTTIQRYETSLEEILRTVFQRCYDRQEGLEGDFELYFGLMKDELLLCGGLLADPVSRYEKGGLEYQDSGQLDRVFYLESSVTLPAGGSVTLTAELTKEASFDFGCAKTGNTGVYGCDLATSLGSNLTFTRQTAVLEDRGQIALVRQSIPFDLEAGVRTAELTGEHCFLEVKRLPGE